MVETRHYRYHGKENALGPSYFDDGPVRRLPRKLKRRTEEVYDRVSSLVRGRRGQSGASSGSSREGTDTTPAITISAPLRLQQPSSPISPLPPPSPTDGPSTATRLPVIPRAPPGPNLDEDKLGQAWEALRSNPVHLDRDEVEAQPTWMPMPTSRVQETDRIPDNGVSRNENETTAIFRSGLYRNDQTIPPMTLATPGGQAGTGSSNIPQETRQKKERIAAPEKQLAWVQQEHESKARHQQERTVELESRLAGAQEKLARVKEENDALAKDDRLLHDLKDANDCFYKEATRRAGFIELLQGQLAESRGDIEVLKAQRDELQRRVEGLESEATSLQEVLQHIVEHLGLPPGKLPWPPPPSMAFADLLLEAVGEARAIHEEQMELLRDSHFVGVEFYRKAWSSEMRAKIEEERARNRGKREGTRKSVRAELPNGERRLLLAEKVGLRRSESAGGDGNSSGDGSSKDISLNDDRGGDVER